MSAKGQKAISILGMHRSGTSAIVRTINLLGAYIGEPHQIMPPQTDNPTGFWEHVAIYHYHERLLKFLSHSWDDVFPLPEGWWNEPTIRSYRQELIGLIKKEFASQQLWMWKDPRTCLVLPLWKDVLGEMGIDVYYLLFIRNPLDVAESLRRRNGFTKNKSLALWQLYNLSSLHWTNGSKRLVLHYDRVLEDWVQAIEKVSESFGIPRAYENKDVTMAISTFLKPDLRHSQSSLESLMRDPDVPQAVVRLYRLLIESDEKPGLLDSEGLFSETSKLYHDYHTFLAGTVSMPEKKTWETSPRVTIIIPVFNKIEYTRKCIESLLKNTKKGLYEIVFVDNGSTDETSVFLKTLGEGAKVISNTENMGYVIACNQGAEIAESEYLLFLNNDTEPQGGWLESLVSIAGSDNLIGAVGAKLIYPDGRLQEAGGMIFSDGRGWNFGNGDDPNKEIYNQICEVDYCSGACLLIRKSLFTSVDGFDVRYVPAYYEDADLCFSVREMGYKVVYNPRSTVIHHESVTAGKSASSDIKKYIEINRRKFVEKWEEELLYQDAHPDISAELPTTACRERLAGKLASERKARAVRKIYKLLDVLTIDRDAWKEAYLVMEADRNKWQAEFNSMHQDREAWKEAYAAMEKDRNKWQAQYNQLLEDLTKDRDAWKQAYSVMEIDRDRWQAEYNSLHQDREGWKEAYASIERDRDNWQAQYNQLLEGLTKDRDAWKQAYSVMEIDRDRWQAEYNSLHQDRVGWKEAHAATERDRDRWKKSYGVIQYEKGELQELLTHLRHSRLLKTEAILDKKLRDVLEKLKILLPQTSRQAEMQTDSSTLIPSEKEKILLIRIDAIGDFILFTATLKQWREFFHQGHLAILVQKYVVPLAETCPYIDEVIPIDLRLYSEKAEYRNYVQNFLEEKGFDITVNTMYTRTVISDEVAAYSEAPIRIGFQCLDRDGNEITRKKNEAIYNHLIPGISEWMFEIDRNNQILQEIGWKIRSPSKPEVWVTEEDEKWADQFLRDRGIGSDDQVVILLPGALHSLKYWPTENYSQVADRLSEEFKVKIIICGGPGEEPLAEEIRAKMQSPAVISTGLTSLRQQAALIWKATLYLGSDTGAFHMATTFGIKTLGIFGGGHFNRFFNSGSKDAQIVYHPMECFQCHWNCVYRDFRCIRAITVDEVYEKAGRLLREPLVLSEASKEAREEDWENRFRARDWEKRAWRKAFYTQRTKNSLPKDSLEMQDGSPQPLPDSALRVGFSNVKIPSTLKANEKMEVHLSVKNEGDGVWPAKGLYGGPTYQVNLTYYWLDPKGKPLDEERRRVPLPRDLYPGDTVDLMVELVAPEAPGTYFLNFEMVQETVAWFGQKNPESLLSIPIQIL